MDARRESAGGVLWLHCFPTANRWALYSYRNPTNLTFLRQAIDSEGSIRVGWRNKPDILPDTQPDIGRPIARATRPEAESWLRLDMRPLGIVLILNTLGLPRVTGTDWL